MMKFWNDWILRTAAVLCGMSLLAGCAQNEESILVSPEDRMSLCAHWKTIPGSLALIPNENKLYVGDSAANRIIVISLASKTIEKEIQASAPIETMASSPDGRNVYAVTHQQDVNTLLAIDTKSDLAVESANLGSGFPHKIVFGNSATEAYITWSNPDKIIVLNLEKSESRIIRQFPNDNGLGRIDVVGSTGYTIANGKLNAVNLKTGQTVPTAFGTNFDRLAVNPDNQEFALLFSNLEGSSHIAFIKMKDKSDIADIYQDEQPDEALYTDRHNNQKLYVSAYSSRFVRESTANGSSSHFEEYGPPRIEVIDAHAHKIINTIPMKDAQDTIGRGIMSPDGRYLYFIRQRMVSNSPEVIVHFSVIIIDTKTDRMIDEIPIPLPAKAGHSETCN